MIHIGNCPHEKAITIPIPYDESDTLETVLNRFRRIGTKSEIFQVDLGNVLKWLTQAMESQEQQEQEIFTDLYLKLNLPDHIRQMLSYDTGKHIWLFLLDKYKEELEKKQKLPQWPWERPPNEFKSLCSQQ